MNVKMFDLDVDTALYVITALTRQKDGLADEVEPLRAEAERLRKDNAWMKKRIRILNATLNGSRRRARSARESQ